MSQLAPTHSQEFPPTLIDDPVKAEYMAYAEKPHMEDAIEIGRLIARHDGFMGKIQGDGVASNGLIEGFEHSENQPAYQTNRILNAAKDSKLFVATQAGDIAGKLYDDRQNPVAAEQLERLTSGAKDGSETVIPEWYTAHLDSVSQGEKAKPIQAADTLGALRVEKGMQGRPVVRNS